MTYVINLGVPPLLFAQVLYGRAIYTSSVGSVLTMLHEYKPDTAYRKFMPPLTGTPEEVNALRDYLYAQANTVPQHPAAGTLKAQK